MAIDLYEKNYGHQQQSGDIPGSCYAHGNDCRIDGSDW